MKHSVLTAFCFILAITFADAQGIRSFKGRVLDSLTHKPLPDATISIFRSRDTLLLNFGFTTPNGNFSISTKSEDSLIITISLVGYTEHTIREDMSSGGWSFSDYGDIKVPPLPVALRGFTMNSSAIRMKGDTIEINASRFKVLPGSDVAQLFKKIPGFEISVKGDVKVNGVNVSKITVDGSDFFGNNPGMVSKNLNADMVETVQVFEDRNPDGSPKEEPASVINLKLKKGKRNGTFGDIMAGYGTDNRYESALRFNNFKNDRKLSFIANSNNINETGFDFGFENWHGVSNIDRNGNDNNAVFFSGGSSGGRAINQKTGGGFTYFNEYKGKKKISLNLFLNRNDFSNFRASTGINPQNDSLRRISSDTSIDKGLALNSSLEFNFSKEIDSTGEYDFGIRTNVSKLSNRKESDNIISLNDLVANKGTASLYSMNFSNSMQINGSYRRTLRKNDRYSFFTAISYKTGNDRDDFHQYLNNATDTFNNLNERKLDNRELILKAIASMPVYKKLSFHISADRWHRVQNSVQQVRTAENRFENIFEQNYINQIDSLKAEFRNTQIQYSLKPYLSVRGKKFYTQGGVTLLSLEMINTNISGSGNLTKQYTKWLPYYSLSYYPGKAYFYLNISKTTVFPGVSELVPVLNLSNNYNRQEGNAQLEPTDKYSLRTYGSLQKLRGFRYFYFGGGASASDNERIWVSRTNENGVNTTSPENASGSRLANAWFNISKKLTKTMNIVLENYASYNKTPQKTDNINAFGIMRNLAWETGLNFSHSDSLELSLLAGWSGSNYTSTMNSALNYSQNIFTYSLDARFLLRTGTEVSTQLNINDQRNVPGIGKLVPLWNAYLQQSIDSKGLFHLKITAYDILKQNTNISRTGSGNFVYITENNQLQRYFMLSLVYKIKNMGGGEEMNYVY